jgi:hypothetical protein
MRYPNRRYADKEDLIYYAENWTIPALAKHLKRDQKTIRNWISGAQKVPWWVPEILRLERYEKHHQLRQMNINIPLARLGIICGEVLEFPNVLEMRERLRQRDAEIRDRQAKYHALIKEHNDRLLIRYR